MKARLAALLLSSFLAASCGSGTVCFGGDCDNDDDDDEERTVSVMGNIDSVAPPNAVRDVVLFVYTELGSADLADGPPFDDFKDADAIVVQNDEFSLERISRGDLTVVLLLDAPEPDGTIDVGDECSVLLAGGDLDDVSGGRQVEIEDLDVDFRESSCTGDQPAMTCGCARADEIVIRLPSPESGANGRSAE
jgi:hypothetical protein